MWRSTLVGLTFAAITAVGAVLGALTILFTGVLFENPWLVAFWGTASASLMLGFIMIFVMDKQMKREFSQGYTTSRIGYPHLEQVDEGTGLIVRAAGEPLLTGQERRARVRAFKASLVGS